MDNFAGNIALRDQLALQLVAERLVYDLMAEVFVDVRPLFDDRWTGIPVVTAGLIEALMVPLGPRLRFFFGEDEVQQQAVWEAIARGTGMFLSYEFHHARANLGPVHRGATAAATIGIFPSAKFKRAIFDYECSVIHDISTLITPQFHTYENIAYHMEALMADIATNAVTACVSAATAADLAAYLGVPSDRLVVAYNGISWRMQDLAVSSSALEDGLVEPFFLILGTREPRKNIMLIANLIAAFPELLLEHRFVITGKEGWLLENEQFPGALQEAITAGKLLFTGFISDIQKCKFLMAADATIYPSLFEGFGLPVVESLSVGTPCIVSCTSSLPEVGGEFCSYFDPYSVLDLHRAIVEFKAKAPHRSAPFRRAAQDSVAKFTWSGTALAILRALEIRISA